MEAKMRKDWLQESVNTIYFGGGTPGMLEPSQLREILNTLQEHFSVAPDAEITIEANPDDIQPAILQLWHQAGFNRISLGIQSFHQEELAWMNRSHTAIKSKECIEQIRAAGFTNFSADLIFGSPLSSDQQLKENVDILIAQAIPHISCYALTVEKGTMLNKMIQQKKSNAADDEMQARHFLYITEKLQEKGYEHYEISNFSLPGFASKHNSSYWKGVPYLGLGPSAHSFDGNNIRIANIANNNKYLQLIGEGKSPGTAEILSPSDQLNEFIMIHLRRSEGLNLNEVEKRFGEEEAAKIKKESEVYIRNEWIIYNNNIITLTNKGKLMADRIASELFVDQ